MTRGRAKAAINRGLDYMQSAQEKNGAFVSFSCTSEEPFKASGKHFTVFLPTIILNSLCDVKGAKNIRERLSAWLLNEQGPMWSFNYWAKQSPEHKTEPYPDDLDDTFCALSSLYRHNPGLINSAVLAKAVKLLLATESKVGGPYRTWLVPQDSAKIWLDIDLAVNCNVAYFLKQVSQVPPSLIAMIDEASLNNTFNSSYYPSPFPVMYFAARAYQGSAKQTLTKAIEHNRPKTAQDTALVISALCELDAKNNLKEKIEFLLKAQRADGSWPAEAFCYEPNRRGQAYYYGSEALATALAIEALFKYGEPEHAIPKQTRQPKKSNEYRSLIMQAKQDFSGVEECLRIYSLEMVDVISRIDTSNEILLMPQLFLKSLARPPSISNKTQVQLSLANFYGWMAYTIYDDFLDGEGDPRLLPVANASLRRSLTEFYTVLPDHEAFKKLLKQTFDAIDGANSWELKFCRFGIKKGDIKIGKLPNYSKQGQLARRSLGHTLVPLAVLAAAGHSLASKEAKAINRGLRHYIIARQLLDDLHDWEEDFRQGRISFVVAAILRGLHVMPASHSVEKLIKKMRLKFWYDTLPVTCTKAEDHLIAAKNYFTQSTLINDGGPLDDLLTRLELSIQKTRAEQARAVGFIQEYKRPLGKTEGAKDGQGAKTQC